MSAWNRLIRNMFGGGWKNQRRLRQFGQVVIKINALESRFDALEPEKWPEQTALLKERLQNGETLDSVLPEAFALVRRASTHINGERPFDVQLLGGLAMHHGMIAEMKTGEGKTLAATAPAFCNALSGKGVHIITPNDYLARRDSDWMGKIYHALGMTVGLIQHGMSDADRQAAYQADVIYGTNNEYGFDYLRDNMKITPEEQCQRAHHFAIVDEVDSILIDEARTPLIISGPSEDSIEKYLRIHKVMNGLTREIRKEEVTNLPTHEQHDIREDWEKMEEDRTVVREGDYTQEERSRSIALTEKGAGILEERLRKLKMLTEGTLFDFENIEVLHHINQALKAVYLFKRDVDYVVKDNQVVIVDEFTGRLMPGRRFSDGLHQALEAKERVPVERESQTYATITFQNYFRMYEKLAGMTGTAKTEEEELIRIYGMPVVEIPTNRPMVRQDLPDEIYKNLKAKQNAIVKQIAALYERKQPVLVGTISIEASEIISRMLKKESIPHTLLNAKYHEQEAEIIASAGNRGCVTIATNMAGRGTDIKLSEGVADLGGLFILGTERHESRRIDDQLRGRSGRQGDAGQSLFFLSLEDDLMRIFGGERIAGLMDRLHVEDNEPITHPLISRAIANAQKRVEGHNFELRKHVLEYDDVMNRQRDLIYTQRKVVLGKQVSNHFLEMMDETLEGLVVTYLVDHSVDEWDLPAFQAEFETCFGSLIEVENCATEAEKQAALMQMEVDEIRKLLITQVEGQYQQKLTEVHAMMAEMEPQPTSEQDSAFISDDLLRQVILSVLDNQWKDHLLSMDRLRESVGLVGYAQKKPIDEYKREAFSMFQALIERISREACTVFFRSVFRNTPPIPMASEENLIYNTDQDADAGAFGPPEPSKSQRIPNWGGKKRRKQAQQN